MWSGAGAADGRDVDPVRIGRREIEGVAEECGIERLSELLEGPRLVLRLPDPRREEDVPRVVLLVVAGREDDDVLRVVRVRREIDEDLILEVAACEAPSASVVA